MMERPPEPRFPEEEELAIGTTVYDVNGDKVGEVVASSLRDGYFVIEQGWLFTHELYLPASAIARQDSMWVGLNLSKDQLKDERWRKPPSDDVLSHTARPFIQPSPGGMEPSPADGGVINLPPPEAEPPLGNR